MRACNPHNSSNPAGMPLESYLDNYETSHADLEVRGGAACSGPTSIVRTPRIS